MFVNSDARVDPDCLARLHEHLDEPGAGLVGATVLLAEEPGTVNSWGNPVHLLGFSWAGGYGHPAAEAHSGPQASVSGAVFAVRRDLYARLGGMDSVYFTYGEDVDLSLRTWLQGARVEVLAEAVAWHHYDFSRNPDKMMLLERNRLITVLTTYQGRTLLALSPLLLASEAALGLRSMREGWLSKKVAGWRWLVGNRRYLRARRNRIQGQRRTGDDTLIPRLSVALDPPGRFGMSVPGGAQRLIDGYWRHIGIPVAGLAPPAGPPAPPATS